MAAAERAAFRPRQQPSALPLAAQPSRVFVGAVVGLGGTGLALGTHAITGGPTPGAVPLAALSLVAVVGSVLLNRSRWRLPALLCALVGVQAAFHLAFGGLAGAPTHAVPGAGGHSQGHTHAGHHAMTGAGLGWQMLTGHVVGVLLTALLLRRGDQTCQRVASIFARPFQVVRSFRTLTVPAGQSWLPAREARPSPLPPRLRLCAAPRRGPPAVLAT